MELRKVIEQKRMQFRKEMEGYALAKDRKEFNRAKELWIECDKILKTK